MIELRRKSKREAKAIEEAKAALEDELKRSRDQIETLNRKVDAMEKRVKSGPSRNEEKDKGPAASEVEREPEEGKKKNADADGVGGDSGNQQPRGNDDPMDVDGGNAPAGKDKGTPKSEPMKTESGNAPDKSGPQVGRDGDKDKKIFRDEKGQKWQRKEPASGSQGGGAPGPEPSGSRTNVTEEDIVVKVDVEGAGVLGLNQKGERVTGVGQYTAVVDPAGLRYIKERPRGAGAASGAIDEWIGLKGGRPFLEGSNTGSQELPERFSAATRRTET